MLTVSLGLLWILCLSKGSPSVGGFKVNGGGGGGIPFEIYFL